MAHVDEPAMAGSLSEGRKNGNKIKAAIRQPRRWDGIVRHVDNTQLIVASALKLNHEGRQYPTANPGVVYIYVYKDN